MGSLTDNRVGIHTSQLLLCEILLLNTILPTMIHCILIIILQGIECC